MITKMRSKIFGLLTAFVFSLVLFVSMVSAVVTLAEWDFDSSTLNPSTDITSSASLVLSNSRTDSYVNGNPSTGKALSSSGWDIADEYVELSINTVNYENLFLKFDEEVSGTGGPTAFKIQYSSDGTVFLDLGITTTTNTAFTTNPMHTFDFSSITTIDNNANTKFRILVPLAGKASGSSGTFHIDNLLVEGTSIPQETFFCNNGVGAENETDLRLNVDIDNRGEGEDEEWLPLDTIEIEVELENNKDVDLDDVIFELGLFKLGSNTNIIDDMIWISEDDEEFEVGDVDEDEDERHVFEFRVDPSEVDEGNYILMVKAYPDGEEDEVCIDFSSDLSDSKFGSSQFSAEIEVSKENDDEKMVIVDEEKFPTPIEAFCSEEVEVLVDIYNIGDKDFQDQVKVSLYNKALGIDLEEVLDGDLDEGEKRTALFTFVVPSDADEKQYKLNLRTFYDYDEDDDNYDEISDEIFNAFLKVDGNCIFKADLSVDTKVESGGKAGENLVVKITLTNTGDKTVNYVLNTAGYSTWADSADLSVTTISLTPGESEVVLVTFDVKNNAFGNQNFNLEVLSGDKLAMTQPVSVFIEKSEGFFSKITGSVVGGFKNNDNWYLWIIGLVNVVLVLSIIFVAVRMLRKS